MKPILISLLLVGLALSPSVSSRCAENDSAPFALWDEDGELSEARDLPQPDGITFHVIKKWNQSVDGYTFLHGVGLAWHEGKLYASIGHNRGAENTVTEEAH